MYHIFRDQFLRHWGIPGMKWGIRRRRTVRSTSEDHRAVSEIKKKHVTEMSNDDLKKLTTRLQLERQLKDLSKSDMSAGQKFMSEVLTNVGKKAVADVITGSVSGISSGLYKILVKGEDPQSVLLKNIEAIKSIG